MRVSSQKKKDTEILVKYERTLQEVIVLYKEIVQYFTRIESVLDDVKQFESIEKKATEFLSRLDLLLKKQKDEVDIILKFILDIQTEKMKQLENRFKKFSVKSEKFIIFEIDLMKLILSLYEAVCNKERNEINRLLRELKNLYKESQQAITDNMQDIRITLEIIIEFLTQEIKDHGQLKALVVHMIKLAQQLIKALQTII